MGKAYFFDDIGCAVLWLQKKEGMENARIWVNDKKTTEWIDATEANWVFGDKHTPMGYGFAATKSPVENPISFKAVVKKIVIGDTLVNKYKNLYSGQISKKTMVHEHVPKNQPKSE